MSPYHLASSTFTDKRGRLSYYGQERLTRVGQGTPRRLHQPDLSLHVNLLDPNLDQGPRGNLGLHAHLRQERHAQVQSDQLLDRLNGGHLNVHVQRDAVVLEYLQHLRSEG